MVQGFRIVRWVSWSLAWVLWVTTAQSQSQSQSVVVVVVREHGAGSAAAAQPHVEALMQVAAKHNQWPAVESRYFADRPGASRFIAERSPHFGILSLPTFLQLQEPRSLRVLGEVQAPKAGGQQFFIVSKTATSLQACKGAGLATTYAGEPRFIEQVVAQGAYRLGEFEVQAQRRPLQPIKRVIRGQSKCALIDDAQKEALAHVEGGAALKAVWQSAKLPGMVVVAFPTSSAELQARFRASLPTLCEAGRAACERVGIASIGRADAGRYKPVIDAYSRP